MSVTMISRRIYAPPERYYCVIDDDDTDVMYLPAVTCG